jgi:hypothetical protein
MIISFDNNRTETDFYLQLVRYKAIYFFEPKSLYSHFNNHNLVHQKYQLRCQSHPSLSQQTVRIDDVCQDGTISTGCRRLLFYHPTNGICMVIERGCPWRHESLRCAWGGGWMWCQILTCTHPRPWTPISCVPLRESSCPANTLYLHLAESDRMWRIDGVMWKECASYLCIPCFLWASHSFLFVVRTNPCHGAAFAYDPIVTIQEARDIQSLMEWSVGKLCVWASQTPW